MNKVTLYNHLYNELMDLGRLLECHSQISGAQNRISQIEYGSTCSVLNRFKGEKSFNGYFEWIEENLLKTGELAICEPLTPNESAFLGYYATIYDLLRIEYPWFLDRLMKSYEEAKEAALRG
jgi:hypothetical protein